MELSTLIKFGIGVLIAYSIRTLPNVFGVVRI